jgi:hypothetical protein
LILTVCNCPCRKFPSSAQIGLRHLRKDNKLSLQL